MTERWNIIPVQPGEKPFIWEGVVQISQGNLALGKQTDNEGEVRLCRLFSPGAWTSASRLADEGEQA